MKRFLLGFLCFLIMTGAAVAGEFEQGQSVESKLTFLRQEGNVAYYQTADGRTLAAHQQGLTLSNAPMYTWYYGCAPTSASMMMGYYDLNGYANLVPGTAESTSFGSAAPNAQGITASSGHLADFWIAYNNNDPDPLASGRAIPGGFDCLADFMGTSQKAANSPDGGTTFYNWPGGTKFYPSDVESNSLEYKDGMYGIGLFVEYKGYNYVASGLYSQYRDGYNGVTGAFTYANYKNEIDNGRPVLIHTEGHTMLGVGYTDPSTVLLHNTWATGTSTMTWGGYYDYGGYHLLHFGVTCAELVPATYTEFDFNGNGKADILWRNTSTGKVDYWFVDGVTRTAYASLGVVSTAWEIEGVGDFDGDRQPDILWRNNSTREVLMTLMDGTAIAASAVVFTDISPDWQIVSVGDFDGDGMADILWRNMNFSDPSNAGKPYISLMDGFSVKGSGYPGGKVPSDWEIQTVGDFDGDGKADIFWRNMNFADLTNGGKGYVWLMNGTAIKSSAFPGGKVASAWEIQGAGDFDGDGKADILLRYTDGSVPSEAGKMIIWFMNGLTIKKSSYFKDSKNAVIQAGLVWDVATLGDYNNDGMSDMVWRNTSTGGVLDCLMNANILTSSGGLGTRTGSEYIIVRNL